MKRRIIIAVGIAWISLWILFLGRELLYKGTFKTYRELSSRSLDAKRSYVTGDRFYEFLMFCRERLPAGSSYRWEGVLYGSIEQRRALYYLYPCLEKEKPEYLLVYNGPGQPAGAGGVFAKLDETRCIIKMRPPES
ncbi:MAG: hypothetical protein ABIJ27_04995 [Candidatus Omnitrophota bacterium]